MALTMDAEIEIRNKMWYYARGQELAFGWAYHGLLKNGAPQFGVRVRVAAEGGRPLEHQSVLTRFGVDHVVRLHHQLPAIRQLRHLVRHLCPCTM